MKSDMNDLKKLVLDIIQKGGSNLEFHENNSGVIKNLFGDTKSGGTDVTMFLRMRLWIIRSDR